MRRSLVVAIVLGCLPSCINVIAHDEQAAAKAATQFAQAAFVDRSDSEARGLITPSLAQQVTGDKLPEMIAKMHPKMFPTQVAATEFEPLLGQRGMLIFLKGTGDGEEFYYRLVMEGDSSSGYRVSGLFRGSGPYPASARRPLR